MSREKKIKEWLDKAISLIGNRTLNKDVVQYINIASKKVKLKAVLQKVEIEETEPALDLHMEEMIVPIGEWLVDGRAVRIMSIVDSDFKIKQLIAVL